MENGKIYRWGIIGLGRIAHKFADDLKLLPNATLHAVAATDLTRAKAFSTEYQVPYAYGRYEDIVNCPDLDVVYIATPHVLHAENTLICLEAGIPVLCEKPFAMDTGQARAMIAAARRNRVFLMEAIWSLFIPGVVKALDWVDEGLIGEPHTVSSDFGFFVPVDPQSRLFNKALGGGALLDIGIYPVMLALQLFGKPSPERIMASATFSETDIDDSIAFIFNYFDNKVALGNAGFKANSPIEATIMGTKGNIRLHNRWHHTQALTLSIYEGRKEIKTESAHPYKGWGYHFEAAHVMNCLEAQRLESDRIPLSFTLDLAETLELIQEKSGIVY